MRLRKESRRLLPRLGVGHDREEPRPGGPGLLGVWSRLRRGRPIQSLDRCSLRPSILRRQRGDRIVDLCAADCETVVLYSHDGCLGGAAARQYFLTHHVPFVWRNLGGDAAAREEWRALAVVGTPVVVVNGIVLVGFDPVEFEKARRVVP